MNGAYHLIKLFSLALWKVDYTISKIYRNTRCNNFQSNSSTTNHYKTDTYTSYKHCMQLRRLFNFNNTIICWNLNNKFHYDKKFIEKTYDLIKQPVYLYILLYP
jgi:hypothetical protein